MQTTQSIVTVWIRVTPSTTDLRDQLIAAVGEAPFESTELEGVRDMQWKADDTNDALAKADRLKSFCDDPALILLKVATYYASGPVNAVTIKDQRRDLTADRPR